MLQIEEWFRRPQRKTERRTASVQKPVTPVIHKTVENNSEEKGAVQPEQNAVAAEKQIPEETAAERTAVPEDSEPAVNVVSAESAGEPDGGETDDMFEAEDHRQTVSWKEPVQPEQRQTMSWKEPVQPGQRQDVSWKEPVRQEQNVVLQDSLSETDELEHISKKIGSDVSSMIDMEKEDILLQQIDEFREKAKQLQQLMQSRETKAKELQGVVNEKAAKATELDNLIHVRQGEADKIMHNVSEKIDAMSTDVRSEMSGLSDTVSKEILGMTQNLTQEISQSTEKTCQVVETATQNMIDQNTRSLEGLKEQLEQLGQLEQINELSTEMNSQITTLKTDIADKIHSEDVKCYRNIQASMDEQSKMLSEGDEKTRQHIQEQMDSLSVRMNRQSRFAAVSLCFTILNFLGIVGILVFLIFF